MQTLTLADAFVVFAEYETDEQGEVIGASINIDFNDEVHMQELYALVDTLFSSLPAELERHYGRYFVDRQAIVRMHWEALGVDFFMQLSGE